MLENDIYVNHTSLNICTIDGMLSFLKETLSFEGKDLQDAILVMCAYSFYLSNEELSLIFPIYPAFTHLSSRVFGPLIKKGYLASEKVSSRKDMEGTAKVFYYVTSQGYQYANSLCHGKLTSKYKKNRAKIAKSHTYYIGYNYIQLLMLGFPMTWQREFLLGSYSYTGRTAALQVDGYCELYKSFGQDPFYTVFIEQDLCTEHNDILVGKLQNYAKYGLMDSPHSSMIIFSLSQKGVNYGANGSVNTVHPYSENKCNKLLQYMDEMFLDDLYDAYITGYPDKNFITALMLKVGAAKATDKELLKRGPVRINRDFIKEFRDYINQNRNPYAIKEFNITRSSAARSRLDEMVRLTYGHLHSKEDFITKIKEGYQICYYATTLVADRIKFAMLSHFPAQQKALEQSLTYFENPRFKNELTEPIITKQGFQLTLRNNFVSEKANIFVEFPSSDVGAWIRSAQYIKRFEELKNIVLILVFETNQQVTDFYKANDCFSSFSPEACEGMLCLMLYDIGKPNKLFFISDTTMKKHHLRV